MAVNVTRKRSRARGPKELKGKAREAEEEKAPNKPSYSREHRERWGAGQAKVVQGAVLKWLLLWLPLLPLLDVPRLPLIRNQIP